MDTIPDTTNYMIAGYAIAFATMAIYVVSIFIRSRNLDQDLSTLKDLDEEAMKKE